MTITNRTFLFALAALAFVALIPLTSHAAAVSVSALTATSTPAYTNTGFATTTRAKTGDTVQFQLTLSGTPLIAPQINIFSMGSTTMSGSGANYYYATTTTGVWTEGPITFRISAGGTAGDATSTPTQASLTGTNVTYDKTGPSLSSVSWSDVDASTQFSAGDTLTITFNETMATSTITSGNVDTTLALSGSHTFGTSPTVSWNTAGTILTLTLGTSPAVATADTVDPTTAVKDAIGNNDATASPVAITDNVAPPTPTGLADTNYHSSTNITLTSSGSSQIRYTDDGSTPTCSTGTVYTATITFTSSATVKAIACDEANNSSSVASAVYTKGSSSNSGSSHHSSGGSSSSASSASTGTTSSHDALLAQLNALIALAQSKGILTGAAPATTPAAGGAFGANLTVGSSGDGVKALQVYLNTHGFVIAASGPGAVGSETTLFGALTKAALAKFQASAGITPASGYFGPLTRAYLNSHP